METQREQDARLSGLRMPVRFVLARYIIDQIFRAVEMIGILALLGVALPGESGWTGGLKVFLNACLSIWVILPISYWSGYFMTISAARVGLLLRIAIHIVMLSILITLFLFIVPRGVRALSAGIAATIGSSK